MPKNSSDYAPPGKPGRGTPRSLSRTLRQLRVFGRRQTLASMAQNLEVAVGTLRKYEKPNETYTIRVKDVQRYQDHLGFPVGVIIAISQIMAAARDQEIEHLEVLSGMLGALVARIDTPPKREECIRKITRSAGLPQRERFSDWDTLLASLVGDAEASVSLELREKFMNPERLRDAHGKAKQERSAKAQARAKPNRKRPGATAPRRNAVRSRA